MKNSDIKAYVQRYESRLNEYGYSPKTLGWGNTGRQEVRFFILSEHILKFSECSILDVGCGFADLYEYLIGCGWRGKYTGVDIVPGLLAVAKKKHPDINVKISDVSNKEEVKNLGNFDFVVASGIFNAKIKEQSNIEHIESSIRNMFGLCNKGVFIDFMSTSVDFQHEDAWHTSPVWAAEVASLITKGCFSLRHDYMPFEFALFLFKEAIKTSRNTYERTEIEISKLNRPTFSTNK